jgi:hypothetical protein
VQRCHFNTSRLNSWSIIAVHGLGGHREESWTCTNDEGKVQWLKDFLPTYVPNARIMTFGYSLECDGISAAEINEIAYKLLDQIAEKALADVSARDGNSYTGQSHQGHY